VEAHFDSRDGRRVHCKEEQDHEYEEENFKVGRKHLIEFVKTLL